MSSLARALLGCALLACAPSLAAAQRPTRPTPPPVLSRDTIPIDAARTREARDTLATGAVAPDSAAPDSASRRAPKSPAVDSVLTQLRTLQDYIYTEYAGDSAVYRASTGVLRLRGRPQVTREGSVLSAEDSIVYREQQQLVEAHGQPKVTGQSQDLQGDVLFYDLAGERATALGARTEVAQGATWYVEGDVTVEKAERVYATSGRFTTDDRPEPQYHFRSDKIKIVRDRVLVAAPARLYFGKVPVFWLPFIVQDLERGRRSGLLTPEFGLNDIVRNSSGYTREISNIGAYWAINDYLGAQVAGRWRSGEYTGLNATLDWNWRRQFLRGNAAAEQYWQQSGSTVRTLRGNASWKPDERTDLSASANYASSSQFLRQTNTDPRQVTQDLSSTLSVGRRFDWGSISLGSTRRQSVATGAVTATLPSFSISPNTFTLFRAASAEEASWYNNVSVQLGLRGSRDTRSGFVDFERRVQDETGLDLSGGLQQLSIGNLSLSATGSLNQRLFLRATGVDSLGTELLMQEKHQDVASWQSSISYRQTLIGQTSLSPTVSLRQSIQRDSLTGDAYVAGPMRLTFGAGTSASLYGFYPGFGPFSAIRHRLSPSLSYGYSPAVVQTPLQERVFGPAGGSTSNAITLTLSQTWEAKLKPRRPAGDPTGAAGDTMATGAGLEDDTLAAGEPAAQTPSAPADAQKVTLLSINTSALGYDFARSDVVADGDPSVMPGPPDGFIEPRRTSRIRGFTTQRVSNSISSDYLRGLTIRMEHELFDRRDLDPNDPAKRGDLGRFAPRLSSLSTSFTLGPNSTVVQWIQRVVGIRTVAADQAPQAAAGEELTDVVNPPGTAPATNNPRSTGSGPWRVALDYRFSRPGRTFTASPEARDDRAAQTVAAQMSFALTPNWAMNWVTDYSITDREFGSHRLVLRRDLYRWEADFSFSLTPYGRSSFNMLVRLKDLPDLKFDYRERYGVDDR